LVAAACGSGESSAPVSVVVPGTEQWTDTGIDLSIDDTVLIEADGAVTPSELDVPLNGPDGHPSPSARQFNVEGLEEANHASLIGRIGEAGAPFQVGSELLSTADTEGRLFLGINDSGVGNNAGEFTATITIAPEAPSVDPATALIGEWRLSNFTNLTFQEDDTWSWKVRRTLDPSEEGGYTFEDGVVTLTTDVGSFYCPDGEIGIYEVVFESQDEMAWTAVSDECIDRIDTLDTLDGETILRYMP
jgi:hypothetical protein